MATQSEVINFIKSNYQFEEINENLFKLVFNSDDGERSQIVFAYIVEGIFVVKSPFASKEVLTPVQAVNAVSETFLGMTVIEDYYALTNAVPIADIDSSEIDWYLQIVAAHADVIENNSTGEDNL